MDIMCRWDGEGPEQETWRQIPGVSGYSASSFGRVRRDAPNIGGFGAVRSSGNILTPRALPRGHLQVTVCIGNRPKTHLVHRLVAAAFLPAPDEERNCVCHRDDDPSNNRPNNLFWGTRRENSQDMVSKRRQAVGERVKSSKLTAEKVLEIRRAYASGQKQYDLAESFGVSQSNVSMIVLRATWRHL
jgi:hypothetical protein